MTKVVETFPLESVVNWPTWKPWKLRSIRELGGNPLTTMLTEVPVVPLSGLSVRVGFALRTVEVGGGCPEPLDPEPLVPELP